ncbi:hypothetical protein AQUCO_04000134v1 [Aquilegia coerulea]|uniref:SWIM-type domain-containing protein n=1 Tax=Aquilegia coerulea TaxID=218851 RepID=A0A2G5CRB4_AQUCA|nr:hypothetical protein AQUCO_04000134v1 [Aquilegia coerulea]
MRGQEFSSPDEVLEFYNAYAKHAGFSSVREGCKARIVVSKSSNGKFVVTLIVEGHNHPLSTPRKTHLLRPHREVSRAHKCLSQQLSKVNIPTHQQYNVLGVQGGGFENIGCTQKDLYNYNRDNWSCFWADATSRRDYALYGDVVVFETTYETNRYKLILAPLMGVNNHGQTIIFGCAFLSDETIPSFIWYCSWHILNKFSEKLDAVKYSVYYKEFYYCIWNSKSKEEFDLVWLELVQRSGLQDNKWLRSMFEIHLKWVLAYTRHVFSVEMTSSQRAESSHSFFRKYVGEDNSMVDFMVQFDRDFKNVIEKPKLKMLNDILVQMSDIYTNEIFYKFQNYVSSTCNKFESMGIPCQHVLAYLHKYTNFEKLPSHYILKRWKKSAKSETVIDCVGIEIVDNKSYFLERSRLIQCCLGVVNKALTSEEAKKVLIDSLCSAEEKINLLVDSGRK